MPTGKHSVGEVETIRVGFDVNENAPEDDQHPGAVFTWQDYVLVAKSLIES